MKMLAFLFVAISVVVEITSTDSEESTEDTLTKWIAACATELEIPQAKLDEYQSMDEPSSDRMAGCLAACIFEKSEVIEDGKISDDGITVFFGEYEDDEDMKEMKKISEKCQKKANGETDKCEIAGAFTKCIYAETHNT